MYLLSTHVVHIQPLNTDISYLIGLTSHMRIFFLHRISSLFTPDKEARRRRGEEDLYGDFKLGLKMKNEKPIRRNDKFASEE